MQVARAAYQRATVLPSVLRGTVTFMPHFAKTKCAQGIKHEPQ